MLDQGAGLDDGEDSGTTTCVVMITPTVIASICANAGDSRAIIAPRTPTAPTANTSSTNTTTTTTTTNNTTNPHTSTNQDGNMTTP